MVEDRKDLRKKTGNHMLVLLLGEVWEIRKELGIEDLRRHDLRRAGHAKCEHLKEKLS